MKKVILMGLVFVIFLSLTGCGGSDQTAKIDLEKIEPITWYMYGNKPADLDQVLAAVNKITEEKIGVTVNMVFLPSGDYTERMKMIMASREKFDLAFSGWTNPYIAGARLGGYLDISKMLSSYPELKKTIPDYLWEAAQFEGGIYSVPNYQAMTKCKAIYLKKDLAEKYHIDPGKIKKMTDLEPYLDQILANEPDVYPVSPGDLSMYYDDPYQFQETSVPYILYDTKTGKLVFEQMAPECLEAEKAVKKWYDKKYIRQDIVTADTMGDLKAGRYAAWTTDGYRPGDVEERETAFGYKILPIPLTDYHLNKTGVTTTMTAVSATSKNPEKALALLQLVNTNPEVFNLLAFGIEDKHYKKLEGNHIKLLPDSGYKMDGAWKIGNIFNGYLLENQPDDLWEQIKKINNESVKDKYLGFVANTSTMTTTISQITTINEQYKHFRTGAFDIYKLRDTANKQYQEAEYQKLIDEVQKQIDEYNKKLK